MQHSLIEVTFCAQRIKWMPNMQFGYKMKVGNIHKKLKCVNRCSFLFRGKEEKCYVRAFFKMIHIGSHFFVCICVLCQSTLSNLNFSFPPAYCIHFILTFSSHDDFLTYVCMFRRIFRVNLSFCKVCWDSLGVNTIARSWACVLCCISQVSITSWVWWSEVIDDNTISLIRNATTPLG